MDVEERSGGEMKAGVFGMGLLLVIAAATGRNGARVDASQAQAVSGFACGERLMPYVQTSLFLDRSGPKRISDKDWERFKQETLVQEFPAGGTVLENSGWWRASDGRIEGGKGFTVLLLAPLTDAGRHRASVERVVDVMKRKFQQKSVLREETTVCAVF
jgi:hypothetical protein